MHADRVVQPARGLVGRGQTVAAAEGLDVLRAQQPGARLQHVVPVGEARAADLVAVQAPAGLHQDRVGLRGPEHIAAALAQADRAVPQGLGQPGRRRVRGPRLQQRIRGAADRLPELRDREDPPGHGLDGRVNLHGPRRAGRVDRDQAGPGQAVHRVAGLGRIGGHGRVAGQVPAGGRRGEDDAGDPGRVEQGGQHQGGPGETGGRDLVSQVHGQRPGHAGLAERGIIQARPSRPGTGRPGAGQIRAGGAAAGRRAGAHPPLPVVIPAPVVAAAGPGADQRGRGVRQRERLAGQVVRQVEGLGPLARVGGEPGAQVGQGFPGAERGDRRDPPVRRGQGVVPPGGDHDPAVGPGRPQAIQVGRVGQVVEDDQPAPLGPGQPGEEALRAGQQVVAGIGGTQLCEGQRVTGQDGVPGAGLHPDQQVHRAAVPELVRQRRSQLRLARSAGGGQESRGAGGGQVSRGAGGGQVSRAAGGGEMGSRPRGVRICPGGAGAGGRDEN